MAAASTLGYPAFPIEIWLAVALHLPEFRDLAVLARTSHPLHNAIVPVLYRRAASSLLNKRALFWGVANELPRTVEAALDAGIDPNLTWHSLHRAFELQGGFTKSSVATLKDFLSAAQRKGLAHPQQRDWHWSAVHIAALKGNIVILDLLLSHGARFNKGCLGLCNCDTPPRSLLPQSLLQPSDLRLPLWTPLHLAVCSGNLEAAELLLSAGASTHMEVTQGGLDWVPTGLTPLHVACAAGQLPMVEWLIDQGHQSRIDIPDAKSQTPLVSAFMYGHWDCFDALLTRGANINHIISANADDMASFNTPGFSESFNRTTMLFSAINNQRFKEAQKLIRLGADIHFKPSLGSGGMVHAICCFPWDVELDLHRPFTPDAPQVLEDLGPTLLEHFLSENVQISNLSHVPSALSYAARAGNLMAVRRLLRAGATVDADLNSPLFFACQNPWRRPILEIITALLEAGAPAHSTKEPPLWILYKDAPKSVERQAITELLIDHGASPLRSDCKGAGLFRSPLEHFLKQEDIEGFEALRAQCSLPVLGEEDMLGCWREVCFNPNTKMTRFVLELEGSEVIAKRSKPIVSILLAQRPIPTDLVLKVLKDGADPEGEAWRPSNLTSAIKADAEPAVLTALLGRGADPNRKYDKKTPLMELLVPYNYPCPSNRSEYVEILLDAGINIYEDFNPGSNPNMFPINYLTLALQNRVYNRDIIPLMLRKQPPSEFSPSKTSEYIQKACVYGSLSAMETLLEIAGDASSADLNIYTHQLLDNLETYQHNYSELDEAIDCLSFLLNAKGVDINAPAPPGLGDTRTAKDKILARKVDDALPERDTSEEYVIARLFQKRVLLNDDGDKFRFLEWKI